MVDLLVTALQLFLPEQSGYLRQDTSARKVYFLPKNCNNEHLLYDFNLAIGDTFYKGEQDTSFTTLYGYYESAGNYYRMVNIGSEVEYIGWDFEQSSWIEGIGSTLGILSPDNEFLRPYLICFSTNGQTLYPNYSQDTCEFTPLDIKNVSDVQTTIYPNPTNGICMLRLSNNHENVTATVFDISGRAIMQPFTNQSGNTFSFNFSSFTAGLYFVRIMDSAGNVGITKIVKQ